MMKYFVLLLLTSSAFANPARFTRMAENLMSSLRPMNQFSWRASITTVNNNVTAVYTKRLLNAKGMDEVQFQLRYLPSKENVYKVEVLAYAIVTKPGVLPHHLKAQRFMELALDRARISVSSRPLAGNQVGMIRISGAEDIQRIMHEVDRLVDELFINPHNFDWGYASVL